MDVIFSAILREATDNNRGDDSTPDGICISLFFAASALVRKLERINEYGTHGHFYARLANRPPHRHKKATYGETDFWRDSMDSDNAHDDLFIS